MAGPKPLRPLHGKSVYLDLFGFRRIKALERQLQLLGAVLEKCFSRDVTHIITNRETGKSKKFQTQNAANAEAKDNPLVLRTARSSFDGQIESPSPFADSPCNVDAVVSRPLTRGQAIVQKATLTRNSGSTNVIECARLWNIKIIHVDAAERWLRKESEKLDVSTEKSTAKVSCLVEPSIKVEDCCSQFRPEFKLLRIFPTVKFDNPTGSCPFGHQFCVDNVSRSSGGPLVLVKKVDLDEKKLYKFKGLESLPSKEEKLLTAGELRRLNNNRKIAAKNKGVCEMCNVKYDNILKHLGTEKHRSYVEDDRNYVTLDQLIDQNRLDRLETIGDGSQLTDSAENRTAVMLSETIGQYKDETLGHVSGLDVERNKLNVSHDRNECYDLKNLPDAKRGQDTFFENLNEISANYSFPAEENSPSSPTEKRNLDGNTKSAICATGNDSKSGDRISDAAAVIGSYASSELSSELPVIRPIRFEEFDSELQADDVVRCLDDFGSRRVPKPKQFHAESKSQSTAKNERISSCAELQRTRKVKLLRPTSVVTDNSMRKLFESDSSSLSDFQGFSDARCHATDNLSYCELSEAVLDTDWDLGSSEESVSDCVSGVHLLDSFALSSCDFVMEDVTLRDAHVTIPRATNDEGAVAKDSALSPRNSPTFASKPSFRLSGKRSFENPNRDEPTSPSGIFITDRNHKTRSPDRNLCTDEGEIRENPYEDICLNLGSVEAPSFSTRLSAFSRRFQCRTESRSDRSRAAETVHSDVESSHCATQNSSPKQLSVPFKNLRYSEHLLWQPRVLLVRCDGVHGNLASKKKKISKNAMKQRCIPAELVHSSLQQDRSPDDDSKSRDGRNLRVDRQQPEPRNKSAKRNQRFGLPEVDVELSTSPCVRFFGGINSETSSTLSYWWDHSGDVNLISSATVERSLVPATCASDAEKKRTEPLGLIKREFDSYDILDVIQNSDKIDSCLGFDVGSDEKRTRKFNSTPEKRKPSTPYKVYRKRKWQPSVVLKDCLL